MIPEHLASLLVSLDDPRAVSHQTAGRKAATLADLRQTGFPVPDGFVLTAELLDRTEPGHLLQEACAWLGTWAAGRAVAVRSSAVEEDLPGASFAGLYESVLDVRGPDAIEEAVHTTLQSASGTAVSSYRSRLGLAGRGSMAVLVQRQIDADAGGVAFTADPRTGDRSTAVITAAPGQPSAVVDGLAATEVWSIQGRSARCDKIPDVLRPEQALELAALIRRVADRRGSPQDVEWALAGGQFSLLQARPITSLPPERQWATPHRGVWMRHIRLGELLPEPITPLCDTWLLTQVEDEFRRLQAAQAGVHVAPPLHVLVNGWYFHSPLGTSSGLALLGGLMRRPQFALGVLSTSVRPELADRLVWRRQLKLWRGLAARYREAVAVAESAIGSADPNDMITIIDRLVQLVGECVWSAVIVGGAAWRAEGALARFYGRRLSGLIEDSYHPLVLGLIEPARATHALVSFDWFRPTLGEIRPSQAATTRESRYEELQRRRLDLESRCRALPLAPRSAERFTELLRVAQSLATAREEHVAALTLAWPVFRRCLRLIGRDLHTRGFTDDAADVHFLMRSEVVAIIREDGVPSVKDAINQRKQAWHADSRLVPPDAVGRPSPLLSVLIPPRRRDIKRPHDEDTLHGVPVSPGVATGAARVLDDMTRLDLVREGEVLIVPATVPALAEVYDRVAAVCADVGSSAAHMSLLAREFGIPVVAGLGDGTRRLSTGQLVTVDGTRGCVTLT